MMADYLTNRILSDKARLGPGSDLIWMLIQTLAAAYSAHTWRAREQFGNIHGDAVAVHNHCALGHRQIVREDAHGVLFGGVQFDDGAAAEPQHLVNGHGGGAEHDGDVDGDFVECGQNSPRVAVRSEQISGHHGMVNEWLMRETRC